MTTYCVSVCLFLRYDGYNKLVLFHHDIAKLVAAVNYHGEDVVTHHKLKL